MTRHEWRGPALSATNLVAGYQQRRLRRSIVATKRLGAQPGELVAVVGPNGTGKSTLLRTLAGVLPPLLGSVDVNGRDMRRLDPRTRSRLVGVLLTDRFDAGLLRTREVIALGRHPATDDAGLLDQNDLAAAWQAAHQVGVANLWTAPFEQLSDGQRQRCLVARALAKEPAVAVLDEPTSHLDLPGRAMLTAALARLTRSRNTAVILSTHDLDHALAHADQLWLVTDGTVVPGAPEDLLANGSLAGAFARGGLTLDPTTATMRVPPRPGPTIAVRGEGLPAQLATRVAHRVGLRTLLDGIDHPADSTVEWELSTTTDGWILFCGRHEHHGTSYDELAHTLRDHLRPRPPDTTRN